MKEKFQRFMIGRYGVDELGKYSLYLLIVLLLYFRMFSKNYAQRRKENDLFLKYKNQVVRFFNKEKRMMQDRVKFHIYTCPSCGQKIRIPRGKGKIAITCPKCKNEFIKKS